METIKRDFFDEKKNIHIFFNYLTHQEERAGNTTIAVHTMQKSSCILILYNLIESMFVKLLKYIHLSVLNGSIKYEKLNTNIRQIILMYHKNIFNNIKKNQQEIERFFLYKNNVSITYDELLERHTLLSGNLDSRSMREIMQHQYGFNIRDFKKLSIPELVEIKNGRNILAHGEQSFEEYGRNLSMYDINEKKKKVFNFIKHLISEFEYYLNQEDYLGKQWRVG